MSYSYDQTIPLMAVTAAPVIATHATSINTQTQVISILIPRQVLLAWHSDKEKADSTTVGDLTHICMQVFHLQQLMEQAYLLMSTEMDKILFPF